MLKNKIQYKTNLNLDFFNKKQILYNLYFINEIYLVILKENLVISKQIYLQY